MSEARRSTTRPLAALLATLLLVLAGCTSSGLSHSGLDKQMKSVLLQLSDFPPSWRAYPATSSESDVLGALADCTGDANGAAKVVTTERSSEYRNGQQRITSLGAGFFAPDAVAKRVEALGNARATTCMQQAMRGRVIASYPGASVVASHLQVTDGGFNVPANQVGSTTGTVTIKLDGKTRTVDVDAVFLTARAFYLDIVYMAIGKPVRAFIENVLTTRVAQRAQHT